MGVFCCIGEPPLGTDEWFARVGAAERAQRNRFKALIAEGIEYEAAHQQSIAENPLPPPLWAKTEVQP